jgi:hypothetical protein
LQASLAISNFSILKAVTNMTAIQGLLTSDDSSKQQNASSSKMHRDYSKPLLFLLISPVLIIDDGLLQWCLPGFDLLA